MSKFLALDQASRITGYAIFEGTTLLEYGKLVFDDEDVGTRLFKLKDKVQEIIEKNDIKEVIFEDIQLQMNVGNNVQTFKVLAEVFGVLEELFTEMNIPYTAVLAGTWKSTLEIKGRTRPEQKRNAQAYVQKTFDIKATQDESDAICIGSHKIVKKITKSADHDWS